MTVRMIPAITVDLRLDKIPPMGVSPLLGPGRDRRREPLPTKNDSCAELKRFQGGQARITIYTDIYPRPAIPAISAATDGRRWTA